MIESDTGHPLFGLLGMSWRGEVKVEARQSSLEDWQKEARKLELQGKQEQAEAIRRTILKQTPVPWPVFDEAKVRETAGQGVPRAGAGRQDEAAALRIRDLP